MVLQTPPSIPFSGPSGGGESWGEEKERKEGGFETPLEFPFCRKPLHQGWRKKKKKKAGKKKGKRGEEGRKKVGASRLPFPLTLFSRLVAEKEHTRRKEKLNEGRRERRTLQRAFFFIVSLHWWDRSREKKKKKGARKKGGGGEKRRGKAGAIDLLLH